MKVLLCFFSFLTATSVVEAMATANAVRKRDAKLHRRRNTVHNHTATVQSETDSATSYESITSNLLDEPSSFSQVLLTKKSWS